MWSRSSVASPASLGSSCGCTTPRSRSACRRRGLRSHWSRSRREWPSVRSRSVACSARAASTRCVRGPRWNRDRPARPGARPGIRDRRGVGRGGVVVIGAARDGGRWARGAGAARDPVGVHGGDRAGVRRGRGAAGCIDRTVVRGEHRGRGGRRRARDVRGDPRRGDRRDHGARRAPSTSCSGWRCGWWRCAAVRSRPGRDAAKDSDAAATMSRAPHRRRAATGFATFVLEVAWFRSLRAAFQATTESFALVLFAVLVRWHRRRDRPAPAAAFAEEPRDGGRRSRAVLVLLGTPIVERADLLALPLAHNSYARWCSAASRSRSRCSGRA